MGVSVHEKMDGSRTWKLASEARIEEFEGGEHDTESSCSAETEAAAGVHGGNV